MHPMQPLNIPRSSPTAVSPASFFKTVKHPYWTEHLATFPVNAAGHVEPLFNDTGITVLHADAFGWSDSIAGAFHKIQSYGFSGAETALTSEFAGGLQVTALSGAESTPLRNGAGIIGRVYEDADARYCFLGNLLPANISGRRRTQAREVFDAMQDLLAAAGMDFGDVVRTWFYLDRILEWYDEFNAVRTGFFNETGITRIPASTGIGTGNAAGAALVAKAVAVRPKNKNVTVRRVDSPRQCEATRYGSSFSRAMEVADPVSRVVYISGTASIEEGGGTVHLEDPARQIEKTMEVVGALLSAAKMTLSDTTRAIAYFKRREYIPLWHDYCRKWELPPLPVILTSGDICRDNLLFEIELDAAASA